MSRDSKFDLDIVVLYCRQCVADEFAPPSSVSGAGFVARFVMIPCSSKVEASYVLKILAEGADGVEVVACPDKKCQFLVGNIRAEKRIGYARNLLEEIKMGAERLGMTKGEGLSETQLTDIAEKRAGQIKPLGPNPMKGENR